MQKLIDILKKMSTKGRVRNVTFNPFHNITPIKRNVAARRAEGHAYLGTQSHQTLRHETADERGSTRHHHPSSLPSAAHGAMGTDAGCAGVRPLPAKKSRKTSAM